MRLPFLPLESVFYPGETVPLHIFEDRYKELISDCRKEAITFGIPVYINNQFVYGTEVQLVEVVTTYDSGEMDVVCVARQVFKIVTFENQMQDKQYAGGTVRFLDVAYDSDKQLVVQVIAKIKELYELMSVVYTPLVVEKFNSYMLAHKMGLSFKQEYELLQISQEHRRLEYIKTHLIATIKVLNEINRTKNLIDLNGNFKNFDPLDFKGFKI